MMFSKKILSVSIAALMMSGTAAVQADDIVSASAAISNMYLWRGIDLGDGSAAVSGDLKASYEGAYAGIWGSSGDSGLGQEIDFYAGYGFEVAGFTIDASLWTYYYPSSPERDVLVVTRDEITNEITDVELQRGLEDDGQNQLDDLGGLSEFVLGISYGPVKFTYYDNIAGGEGYHYYTLGGSYEQFSATIGYADFDNSAEGTDTTWSYSHLTVGYAFNDNLSFSLSQVLDRDYEEKTGGVKSSASDIARDGGLSENDVLKSGTGADSDLLFQVVYSVPLK